MKWLRKVTMIYLFDKKLAYRLDNNKFNSTFSMFIITCTCSKPKYELVI